MMRHWLTGFSLLFLASQGFAAPTKTPRLRAEIVSIPSGNEAGSRSLSITAWWIKADDKGKESPTIIALHGCGGLYSIIRGPKSEFTPRYITMAKLLNREGYNVLFPDSFTARGKSSVCRDTQREQRAGSLARRFDVQAAMRWLAKQKEVDTSRIALIGWSQGASTVLATLNEADTPKMAVQPAAAVAFYPECRDYLGTNAPYRNAAPLLILMGEDDDWTPPQACTKLEQQQSDKGSGITLHLYPDSHHNFDAPGLPILVRMDVDGASKGVTMGSNTDAGSAAYNDLLAFLKEKMR
ncbi:dienelactone hydrolase family protein [Herbaspirillum sp. RTI4]|uniref:dienelactone hydrolase family protein n=1 Tax=Herbaspirillum sp. RTI4 TaxID=3048640 RepID=UPI002AB3344F|nr:dienelactone hydrolase family protein [Herbaspirillum sp. RTI4]MDY7579470.1 dienelactone hydrolase family protein [Herbaspirillum sp. RTI4]MEA9980384.1 dienelactone hydrolase family protein [Herbaspirillum sp. RTI4]